MNKAYAAARNYTGPVKGVILDWSGTTADKYVLAPAVVFVEVFNKHKVMITVIVKISQNIITVVNSRDDFHSFNLWRRCNDE